MIGKNEMRNDPGYRTGEMPGSAATPAFHNAMKYQITVEPGYLRADLFFRRTAGETREFLNAVAAEGLGHQCWRVLISVHASRPIFTVEKYGFSSFLDLATRYAEKIALHADAIEIHLAHDYAALLARARGINMRSFRDQAAAIAWLKDRRYRTERRQRTQRYSPLERRKDPGRRQHPAGSER
jgi:hypothetical protein